MAIIETEAQYILAPNHMTRSHWRLRAGAVLTVVASAAAASACGGDALGAGLPGRPIRVVAAENVWGSIAAQLGGGRVSVTSVVTDKGLIETGVVINAGGIFAREIGAMVGVNVPIVPMAHEYLITKPTGIPVELPTMRDPSLLVYFRPDAGGLVAGGY